MYTTFYYNQLRAGAAQGGGRRRLPFPVRWTLSGDTKSLSSLGCGGDVSTSVYIDSSIYLSIYTYI